MEGEEIPPQFLMIIFDYNQIVISNLMIHMKAYANQIDEDFLRHMVLNSIRATFKKFKYEYGKEVIIACDAVSWRKKIFPYYKANRVKTDDGPIPWTIVLKFMDKIRIEIEEIFPYNVIKIDGAEADDIIGVLVHKFGLDMSIGDPILIVSADRDFIQLQQYANVFQYDPIRSKMVKHNNPSQFKIEHIIKGDRGDGIPNALSSDDSFVTKKRQTPITQKKLKELTTAFNSENLSSELSRNKLLIDLEDTPNTIKKDIVVSYNKNVSTLSEASDYQTKIFNYFISKKLKKHLDSINDFI